MKEHIEKKADAMILPHKCLFLLNESHFVAIYKATGLYAVHRQRTCEGYFANSLRPISYLGVIWELYVLGLKTIKCSKAWTRDSQCCCSAENTPNPPKIFGPICLPKPKSWGFSKESSLWVFVVRDSVDSVVYSNSG